MHHQRHRDLSEDITSTNVAEHPPQPQLKLKAFALSLAAMCMCGPHHKASPPSLVPRHTGQPLFLRNGCLDHFTHFDPSHLAPGAHGNLPQHSVSRLQELDTFDFGVGARIRMQSGKQCEEGQESCKKSSEALFLKGFKNLKSPFPSFCQAGRLLRSKTEFHLCYFFLILAAGHASFWN